jgi:hypothetical protein
MSRLFQTARESEGGSMTMDADTRFTDRAFSAYKVEHGISDSRRLGDMPLQVVSEVMQAAQKLKQQEAHP